MKNIAVVEFSYGYNSRFYDFKNHIEDLKIGNLVVVDTRDRYEIAKVVAFKDHSKNAHKWTVSKIDTEQFLLQLEKEQKIKAVKEKMEERRKKVQEMEVYRILAKEDPEMAEMLQEYEELTD